MFIRRTQTRSTASGETYFTHRLVRSVRVGDKVRQRTLLNLGRHFDAAQSDWPALCRRIEEVLGGQLQLAPDCPPALESHAQHIAAQLLARHADLSGAATPPQGQDFQQVDVDSLELIRPRSVGVEHVGLWAMDQLGLRTWLQELGIGPSLRAATIGSIIARMHARAPSVPPGAGSANAARSMSCWESTSRPWSRCSSIAPPMFDATVDEGNHAEGRALSDRMLPIVNATDGAVARTKAALELVGVPCGAPRPPRRPAEAADREMLSRMLRDLGVTTADIERTAA